MRRKWTADSKQLTARGSVFGALMLIASPALALAAEEGGEHGAMFLGVPTFVWFTIINFAIFVSVLVIVLRKPLMNFLKGRSEQVKKDIEDSKRILEEAEAHHADVTTRLNRLEAEIASLRETITKEGEQEGERIVERANQAAERIRRETDFQAEQEVKMAKAELQAEAARLAVTLAEEILDKNVTDQDLDRLLNEFLKEVRAK